MTVDPQNLKLPSELIPKDGRFGAGPSKVRQEQLSALANQNKFYLGTSHRQKPVKNEVAKLRQGLREFFQLPDDYEIILGNGGSTLFWDAAVFSIIQANAQFLSFGEFGAKFAASAKAATHLNSIEVIKSDPGTAPDFLPSSDFDIYATPHNETSTGVMKPVKRASDQGLFLIDATSAAAGALVAPEEFDCYYFAPQKSFGSEGGLFVALASPKLVEQIQKVKQSNRFIPPILDLSIALENSRLDQTYNTPSLSTIFLMREQVDWFNQNGGIKWTAARSKASSDHLYQWAENKNYLSPFVQDKSIRSTVIATIDFDKEIEADLVAKVLRANGIVDVEPYRKLGRNQLRIATFPAIELSDIQTLTAAIDWVVSQIH